MHIAHTINS